MMRTLAPLAGSLVALTPALGWACAVCGQAKNAQVERTYILMTLLMSLTPLAMILGLAAFVVIRLRRHEREQQLATAPASEPSGPTAPGQATP